MKIFLTGASGYVGRNLAKQLIGCNHTVTAAVRSSSDRSMIPLGCNIVNVDLMSVESISKHLIGTEIIFHVAGAVKARSSEDFDRINAGVTAAVVKAAKANCPEALLILTSSQAAAGPSETGPLSSYGRSKGICGPVASYTHEHFMHKATHVYLALPLPLSQTHRLTNDISFLFF